MMASFAEPSSPGAAAPHRISLVQADAPMPVFLKRKPADYLGVLRGEPPKRLFASFLHAEKGRGRAFNILFWQDCVLYARTNHEADFLYALMPRGTPFLDVKKGGKEASGGKAP